MHLHLTPARQLHMNLVGALVQVPSPPVGIHAQVRPSAVNSTSVPSSAVRFGTLDPNTPYAQAQEWPVPPQVPFLFLQVPSPSYEDAMRAQQGHPPQGQPGTGAGPRGTLCATTGTLRWSSTSGASDQRTWESVWHGQCAWGCFPHLPFPHVCAVVYSR